jgi:hypothetical protein
MSGDARAVLIGIFIVCLAIVAFTSVIVLRVTKQDEIRNRSYVACITSHTPAECKLARP